MSIVNDRPYAASSILSVALSKLFRTALTGTCKSHPELVGTELALTVSIPVVPCGGDAELPRRLFEPLGWDVAAIPVQLDPHLPTWGNSDFVSLTLTGEHTVQSALRHLYVLLPVLDDVKHYWVGPDEADKLIRVAGEWLASHPDSALIMSRYLARRTRPGRIGGRSTDSRPSRGADRTTATGSAAGTASRRRSFGDASATARQNDCRHRLRRRQTDRGADAARSIRQTCRRRCERARTDTGATQIEVHRNVRRPT